MSYGYSAFANGVRENLRICHAFQSGFVRRPKIDSRFPADRFFIRVFSAFRKEISDSSGSLQMGNGKLNVA